MLVPQTLKTPTTKLFLGPQILASTVSISWELNAFYGMTDQCPSAVPRGRNESSDAAVQGILPTLSNQRSVGSVVQSKSRYELVNFRQLITPINGD